MTKYLFLDNFRGFTNTYIPIVDVNFLVGENSSGKTSVLSLLNLLSTQAFIWGQKFSNRDINFGHFQDMVSAHSSDRSYFSFGMIEDHPAGPSGGGSAMLYTFGEHDGLARLSSFAANVGRQQMFLRFDGEKAFFKSEALPDMSVDSLRNVMPKWAAERCSERSSGYREVINAPGSRIEQYPLYVPFMMAIDQSSKQGEHRLTHPLSFPRQELVWIAPIRTKPDRTYNDISQSEFSPEGSHTPYLIRRALQSSDKKKFEAFIHRAGEASGLFESIKIKPYGDDITAPFEVDAVLDGTPLNLINVGYGVSQSLPVFVEMLTRPKSSWFAIQQPEVHLHPRAQAALGDAIFEMAVADDKRFLVETHSDFAIDRFRMNYRRRTRKPTSQVLFFERRNKQNTVTPLLISSSGEFPSKQPDGYRRFFVKEEMRLLGL
jgi:hypothetical protein